MSGKTLLLANLMLGLCFCLSASKCLKIYEHRKSQLNLLDTDSPMLDFIAGNIERQNGALPKSGFKGATHVETIISGLQVNPKSIPTEGEAKDNIGSPSKANYDELRVDVEYCDFFRKLNLSVSAVAALEKLLVDRLHIYDDVGSTVEHEVEQGKFDRSEAFSLTQKAIAGLKEATDQQIKSTIGEGGFSSLTEYDKALKQHMLVYEVQQLCPSHPITPLQERQLQEAVIEHPEVGSVSAAVIEPGQPSMNRGGLSFAPVAPNDFIVREDGSVFSNVPVTEDLVKTASSILTPDQVDALRDVQEHQALGQSLAALPGN